MCVLSAPRYAPAHRAASSATITIAGRGDPLGHS